MEIVNLIMESEKRILYLPSSFRQPWCYSAFIDIFSNFWKKWDKSSKLVLSLVLKIIVSAHLILLSFF